MTAPIPLIQPAPLPDELLDMRTARECRWERNDRAGDARLREIQNWAKEQLVEIFIAQALGGNENDEQFLDLVDGLYDPIRNALTRQDLIRGFLLTVEEKAEEKAKARLKEFREDLDRLTGMENA